MAVTKRLRYEVLRRDQHTCRYCGNSAPEVKLTVDHVLPVALGGSDDPTNLVTACADCNAGKSASSADSPIVADVNSKAIAWAAALEQVAQERSMERASLEPLMNAFAAEWDSWKWTTGFGPRQQVHHVPIPSDWKTSVAQLHTAGLSFDDILELEKVALENRTVRDEFKYFCGAGWKRVQQIQERASEIVDDYGA